MKLFQRDELKTLWPFYLEFIVSYLLYFAPAFWIIFFMGLNFSLFQISLIIAAGPLMGFIFEIPTGAIADLYGRKFSVILGYFLEGTIFLTLFFVTDFYFILILFALYGLASTLSSGSKEAWAVDLIKGKKKKFVHNYFIKSKSLTSFALVLSGILGAFLVMQFGLRIIWIAASASLFFSAIVLLFAKEIYIKRKIKISKSLKEAFKQTKTSISYAKKHSVLFYFLLASFFMVFTGAFSESLAWIPFLQNLNFPSYAFGYLWSGIFLVAGIAPLFSKKLLNKSKMKYFIFKMSLIASVLLLLVYFIQSWWLAILLIIITGFFWNVQGPISRTYFHKFIPTKLRSTIGSVEAMLLSIAGILALPLGGYLIDLIGARYVIMIAGGIGIIGALIYLKIKEPQNN